MDKKRVFISYKRLDQHLVLPLVDTIQKGIGEDCWIDQQNIRGQDRFTEEIIRAIDDADVFLFMFSWRHLEKNEYDKDWTKDELNYALAKDKQIFLIKLDNTQLDKYYLLKLGQYQQSNVSSDNDINKLIKDIKEILHIEDEEVQQDLRIQETTTNNEGVYSSGLIFQIINNEAHVVGFGRTLDEYEKRQYIISDGKLESDTEIIIPSQIQGHRVTRINRSAFYSYNYNHGFSTNKIESISIPNTIRTIDSNAFEGCCNLKTINLPSSLVELSSEVFAGCQKLTNIVIPDNVRIIRHGAFCGSGLERIDIPNKVIKIEDSAFESCSNLRQVKLPLQLQEIGMDAFKNCYSLLHIEIPKGTKIIGQNAFQFCEILLSVLIPESVEMINDNAFEGCQRLQNIAIDQSDETTCLMTIGYRAFQGCLSLDVVELLPSIRYCDYDSPSDEYETNSFPRNARIVIIKHQKKHKSLFERILGLIGK